MNGEGCCGDGRKGKEQSGWEEKGKRSTRPRKKEEDEVPMANFRIHKWCRLVK